MKSDLFFSSYKLQPWDMGELQGPFPRTEIMCIRQSSACPPDDSFCLSPVSFEQVPCDEAQCLPGSCTRTSILVDKNDSILLKGMPLPENTLSIQEKNLPALNNPQNQGEKTDEKDTNEGENHPEIVMPEPARILGCFDAVGIWTTDRSQCAENQKRYVKPAGISDDVQDEQIDHVIEVKFIPETRKSELLQHILTSTTEAGNRIDKMLENQQLPQDVRTELEQKLERLRIVERTAPESDLPARGLQLLADAVAGELTTVQTIVTTWMESPGQTFPVTVTDRLDRIFSTLPSIFGLLIQENIPLESTTMDAYINAQQTYDFVRPSCMENADSCANLSQAIDALEPLFAAFHLSLESAGRMDLEEQIDLLMQ